MTDLTPLKAQLIADISDYITDFEKAGQVAVQFGKAQKTAGDQVKKNNDAYGGAVAKFKSFALTGAAVTATLAGIAVTAKKAWQFIGEGAELLQTQERFNRLALEIGTTGEALKNQLSPAIRGMMTDMDAMGLATQLMSLGLAKNTDEAVRLTRVASALAMPLNDLILTLTNQRTMRFDQLNVQVDGFNERLKKLKETMSDEEAFKMAFLAQAEEQILRVGDSADTAAGDLIRLENEWANLKNTMSMAVVEGVTPWIARINDEIEANKKLHAAYDAGAISLERYKQLYNLLSQVDPATIYMIAEAHLARYTATMERHNDLSYRYSTITLPGTSAAENFYANAAERAAQRTTEFGDKLVTAAEKAQTAEDIVRALAGATADLDGSFANNTSMAQSMLDEWEWAQAGGAELQARIEEIGSLQVEPEVKKQLLEEAMTAAVELDISLGNISEYDGAALLKDSLNLETLEAASKLLSDGEAGILDDLKRLDENIYIAKTELDDKTEQIRENLESFVGYWAGTHVANFVATYSNRGGYTGGGVGSGSGDDDTDMVGGFSTGPVNNYYITDDLGMKMAEEQRRAQELATIERVM